MTWDGQRPTQVWVDEIQDWRAEYGTEVHKAVEKATQRESWTWVDSRTRKRVSITSTMTREQAELQLAHWQERDAKGGRPDLHEAMPFIVVAQVPEHLWGSDPGDVIPEIDDARPTHEGPCTRSLDGDGKPLHYCAVCYQDMP